MLTGMHFTRHFKKAGNKKDTMNQHIYFIHGGLYLVIDPSVPLLVLINKTSSAIQGGVGILQIWNHWPDLADKKAITKQIAAVAHQQGIPVLINENRELLQMGEIDGIHFDEIPTDLTELRSAINRPFITGITCGNDFSKIEWAVENGMDYISFCSVFPSGSVDTCEIINRDIIRKARSFTNIPIFLSGGITLDNLSLLEDTGMNGIAVISGIMNANNTLESAQQYSKALHKINLT